MDDWLTLNEVDVNKLKEKHELLTDSWRFQIACDSYSSFNVPHGLKDKLSAFSSLYEIDDNQWKRKLTDIPNLEMALSIGMPIHQSMRSVTIQMEQLRDGIDEVAKNINTQLKEHGLIPQTCKIMVLASLQLRDISDPTSWASKPFPKTPHFFYSDNPSSIREKYEIHINALKTEFPKAHLADDLQTVTSSLCDGNSNISSLLVRAGSFNSCEIIDDKLKIEVEKKYLENCQLNENGYQQFCGSIEKDFLQYKKAPVYAAMLLGLLKYWDVMVITANNICLREDCEHPRGLAGFVLCFERGEEVVEFFPFANALFVPLIHLYAKAALLEGAQHFYDTGNRTSEALHKIKIAISELQVQRNTLHEHISRSYGEDLARFRNDLEFKHKDDRSLEKEVFSKVTWKHHSPGVRGLWHTKWGVAQEDFDGKSRLILLKAWFQKIFPQRYPHLWEDDEFQLKFVEKINGINNEVEWDKCFGSGHERLELLMLKPLCKEPEKLKRDWISIENQLPEYIFYQFEVFSPHLKKIYLGIRGNFPASCEIKAQITNNMFTVRISGKEFTKDEIATFIGLVKQENTLPYAELTRTRFMPIMWNKLYHRKAEVAWLNDSSGLVLTLQGGKPELPELSNCTDIFNISEFRFFFE